MNMCIISAKCGVWWAVWLKEGFSQYKEERKVTLTFTEIV